MPMRRKMCRTPALAATGLIIIALAPLAARAAQPDATNTPVAASAKKADVAAKPPHKATPEQRAEAERLDPLARATFWTHELQIDSTDPVAGVKLASALRALGQYTQAADTVGRVLVNQPNNFDALLEVARDYIADGQGFYAIEPAQHAQTLAPRDWRPWSLVGVAYTQVHREDDAKAAWAKALTLSPENPAVLSNMAMTLAAQGDAPGAETLLRRAAVQPGATLQIRENLTLVLGLQGKFTEAETLLRQNLPPDQAEANLAYLHAVSSHDATPVASAVPTARSWESLKGAGG